MKFPKNTPRVANELKIPDLSGGLNLRDGLSEILDNQLIDCKNMWWNDGLLKTRPGMRATKETVMYIGRPAEQTINIRNFPEIKYVESNKSYYLQVIQRACDMENDGNYTITFQFVWRNENENIPISSFNLNNDSKEINYFVCCKKNILYCFTNKKTIHKLDITNKDNQWEDVKEGEYYTPTVYTHCTNEGWSLAEDAPSYMQYPHFKGTMFEGFNIIGNSYKMIYSTVNKALSKNYMVYRLATDLPVNTDVTVKASYIDRGGVKHPHTVSFYSDETTFQYNEENAGSDNLYMQIELPNVIRFCTKDGGQVKELTQEDYVEDNLEIIVPYLPAESEKAKIFNMTRCEWFGGAATGIMGGTRLFLCGNKGAEKSLVCWSGLDNPLYFPENSYFYVGDTTSAVTGFGKQSDMLVIFKENETWYTKYNQNTGITAKDLINQSVVDFTSSSVYFPLVQINSSIGCDKPDTIKLCRNRLVWFSSGKVYTLVSENQYNERSIFCVSEMIEKKLKNHIGIQQPTACDWNGYYCLCFEDKMYLMDYNCYGYTHISSYSKTEDANIRIPWYFWEFAVSGAICAVDDKLIFSYYHDGISYNHCAVVNNVLTADYGSKDSICYEENDKEELLFSEENIESKATTKIFDLGRSDLKKNVEKINLQLGNNGGDAIKVKIITECGEEEHEITLMGAEAQSYTPGYIDSKAIFPCIRQVLRMGLEFSSTGVIAIDGMNIKFRMTGGAR